MKKFLIVLILICICGIVGGCRTLTQEENDMLDRERDRYRNPNITRIIL